MLSGGERVGVTAWGSTTDQARLQAQRIARLVAGLDWEARLLGAVTGAGPEDQAPVVAAVDGLRAQEPLGVPGVDYEPGSCARDRLPGESRAWRATWTGGDGTGEVRHSAAAALEASRRRTCMPPYQSAVGATLDELVESPPEDRALIREMGLDHARRKALACLARSDPRLIPSPEAAAGLAQDSRWLECTARSWQGAPLPPGVAWGRDVAEVAEAALTEHLVLARRSASAQAARAWARAWPEVRDGEVRLALDLTVDVIAPTPDVAYSTLSCRALTAAGQLDWQPGRFPLAHGDACAPAGTLRAAPVRVDSPDAAGLARREMCQQRTWHSLPVYREVRSELSDAMLPVMALGTWGDLAGCDAVCEGTAGLRFSEQEALGPWPGGPDRSSLELAKASLESAVAAQDLGALLLCVTPELRAGLMQTWRREGALFWRVVPELLRANGPTPVVSWHEVEVGSWVLVPR